MACKVINLDTFGGDTENREHSNRRHQVAQSGR
jgi:hypothetical protein